MNKRMFSAFVCVLFSFLFLSACSFGFMPAWKDKGKPVISLTIASLESGSSLSSERALIQGSGYLYIRTIGSNGGIPGTLYGPYRVTPGQNFESSDIPPGVYEGIGFLFSVDQLDARISKDPAFSGTFLELMQLPDAEFNALSGGGPNSTSGSGTSGSGGDSPLTRLIDGDASGAMVPNVTLVAGETKTFDLTLRPMTSPDLTVDFSVSTSHTFNSATPGILVKKFLNLRNIGTSLLPGFAVSELTCTITPDAAGRTLGNVALYDKDGKLLKTFAPTGTISAAKTFAFTLVPDANASEYFLYCEYKAPSMTLAFGTTLSGPAPSSAKAVTAFGFTSPAANGTIAGTNITVTVPLGTNVTNLPTVITYTGMSISPLPGVAQDFTSPVTYTVTAADLSVQTYTVTVLFGLSADADLTSLVVSPLILSPSFLPAVTSYTSSATNSFSMVSVTPTSSFAGATIQAKINGGSYSAVASGSNSGSMMLDAPNGANLITVQVTAEDGITVRLYTIAIAKTVMVSINNGANGSATPVSFIERIPGSTVALTATANPGYRFDSWSGSAGFANVSLSSTTLTVGTAMSQTATANFVPDFAGGDGAAGTPYLISNITQLMNMNYFRSSFFQLTAGFSLASETNWLPIGDATTNFTGGFDGNGFVLTGLTINSPGAADRGLFGYTNGAVIKNVKLTAINFISTWGSAGGLIGFNSGSTTVTDCTVDGTISAYTKTGGLIGWSQGTGLAVLRCGASVNLTATSMGALGGLIGEIDGGTVNQSYATGSILGTAVPTIGGLIGFNNGAMVGDCYATGAVNGTTDVGGLIGMNNSGAFPVNRCYAVGLVTGLSATGGLVGTSVSGTINASYYDGATTLQIDTGKGTSESTANMQSSALFSSFGWDFATLPVWKIVSGYPLLNWQP